jgi:cytoskeletal protein CcmA (bactofilin family)
MWRKPAEAKPSSQASDAPAPAPVQPATTSQIAPVPFADSTASISPAPISTASISVSPAETSFAAPSRADSSTIVSGLKITGEITGTSDLFIDGEAHGKIRLVKARVTVGPQGRVNADIEGREIVIEGSVKGNIKAGERVQFGPSARFQGSVLSPKIAIAEGARFSGKVEMVRASDLQTPPAPATTADSESLKVVSASAGTE